MVLREFCEISSDLRDQFLDKYVVGHYGREIVVMAFSFDGFIAGGAAHAAYAQTISDHKAYKDDDPIALAAYLKAFDVKVTSEKYFSNEPQYWRAGYGDLDLFFPTHDHVRQFVEAVHKRFNVDMMAKNTPSAHELIVPRAPIVQAVKMHVGTMEDVLSTFDITNAMVAVGNSRSIAETSVAKLIETRTLDAPIVNIKVIKRLHKWMRKQPVYNDVKLTPRTAAAMFAVCAHELESLNKEQLTSMISKLIAFRSSLSSDNILLLLSLLGNGTISVDENDYSFSAKLGTELVQRGRVGEGNGE